jgi:polyisoprenoid-binding protein YceI
MTSTLSTRVPGYLAGTWTIDASHSEVGFAVRHLMVSKVRGKFTSFEGSIVTAEDPLASSVTATSTSAAPTSSRSRRTGP